MVADFVGNLVPRNRLLLDQLAFIARGLSISTPLFADQLRARVCDRSSGFP